MAADRVRQAFQPVAADDQRVRDTAVLEFAEHGLPLLRTFAAGGAQPQAEDVAFAVEFTPIASYTGRFANCASRTLITVASINNTG